MSLVAERITTSPTAAAPPLRAIGLTKTYRTPDHIGRLVLDSVDFTLRDGEIVAILGKSGAGKSTFMRILAGLLPPSAGRVEYRGQPVTGPVRGIAMVFQSFALFPWLTVLGNVELGLEAQGVSAAERRRRALVVNPDILLLDEPFSQLDVLTAETLRNDLLDLWVERRIPTKGILIVSHNIEEAVDMADRILIFSSDPGGISAELTVRLPHPRSPDSPAFRQIVDQVYTLLTTVPGRDGRRGVKPEPIGVGYRLPDAPVQQLSALVEKLTEEPYNGRADLPHLADEENLTTDELLPLLELLQLLGLANVSGGDIEVTGAGRRYAEADMLSRKQIFSEALLKNVPLAVHIRRVLDERPGHRAPAARFLRELEDHLSEEEAERVLDTVINWGRHAEIFAYDYDSEVLSLENF